MRDELIVLVKAVQLQRQGFFSSQDRGVVLLDSLSTVRFGRLVHRVIDLDGSSRTDLRLLDQVLGLVVDFDRRSERRGKRSNER